VSGFFMRESESLLSSVSLSSSEKKNRPFCNLLHCSP